MHKVTKTYIILMEEKTMEEKTNTEQQMVVLYGSDLGSRCNRVTTLLEEGWRVVNMCSFNQSVALNYGNNEFLLGERPTRARGDYGVVFIVEREIRED